MGNPLKPKNLAAFFLLCFILPGFLEAGEVKGPQGAAAPMAPAGAAGTSAPIPALGNTVVSIPSSVAPPKYIILPVSPGISQPEAILARPASPLLQSGELSQPQKSAKRRAQAARDDMALLINILDSEEPFAQHELALSLIFDGILDGPSRGMKTPQFGTTRKEFRERAAALPRRRISREERASNISLLRRERIEAAEGPRVTQLFEGARKGAFGAAYPGFIKLTPDESRRQQKDIDHGVMILRSGLSRWGLDLSPEQEQDLRALDLQVAQLNGLYGGTGYHGSSHQTGVGSVAELAIETLRLKRPEGMSTAVFKDLLLAYYKAARVHDVEGVFVYSVAQKDGTTRYFLKYSDSSKPTVQDKGDASKPWPTISKFDLNLMGTPLLHFVSKGNEDGTDNATLHLYAKSKGTPRSPGTRSYLLTTLRTIDAALPQAQDPVVKYLALKGTVFSPQELKLAAKLLPILEKKIREKYQGQADRVLEMLDSMAEQLGGADFFDHYVRRDGLLYASSLQDEFQAPYVKLAGTFDFFRAPLGDKPAIIEDKRYVDFYAQLPRKYREALVRNFVYLKIVSVHKDVLKHDVRDVLAALDGDAAVQKLIKDVPAWAGLGLAGAYNMVKGLDVSGLKLSLLS